MSFEHDPGDFAALSDAPFRGPIPVAWLPDGPAPAAYARRPWVDVHVPYPAPDAPPSRAHALPDGGRPTPAADPDGWAAMLAGTLAGLRLRPPFDPNTYAAPAGQFDGSTWDGASPRAVRVAERGVPNSNGGP